MNRSLTVLLTVALAVLAFGFGYYTFERSSRHVRTERAVAIHADEVFRSPSSIVAGNPDGDVSVVAFFDYNCPYCRKDAPDLVKLVADDGRVRLVLKELPVLGPDSEAAARIALVADAQGKYFEFHKRLIGANGRVTRARALSISRDLGLDMARLERDMDDPAIAAALLANTRLADELGVRGVPFYLVGDRVVPESSQGFYGRLAQSVAEVREKGCRAVC
ncbi:MAG: DsbA family protein [Methyloceanibacter sp.]